MKSNNEVQPTLEPGAADLERLGAHSPYWVGHGALTVRFAYREGVIRIIGAGYWRRGKKIYEEQN